MPTRALLPFLLTTFAITWSLIGFYIYLPEQAVALLGEISGSHPVFFVATWAPALAAVAVVFAFAGASGIRSFFSRLLKRGLPASWIIFVLVGVPLVFIAGSLIKGGPILAPLPDGGVSAMIGVLFMMLFLGPVEEFGWRGVMQPLLQRRVAPLWAGVFIGATWGVWHLPAFALAGTVFGGWSFWPFFVGNVALAVLATPLLNKSKGGLLWPVLFHWQLINPIWPDAQPWDTWILVGVAVVVVVTNRNSMFSSAEAVTDVVPQAPIPVAKPAA